MEYNLVDIHFHSNLSYDAYENVNNGIEFNVKDIFNNSKVKMVCVTDHNIFDYAKYLSISEELSELGIKCLPGMELTIDGIHWIIIIDEEKLKENSIGNDFSKDLLLKIGININNYDIKNLRDKQYNVDEVIHSLEKFGINYIAIPHLDKDKGIYHGGQIDSNILNTFLNYIRDNIVYGFETKYHDQFFIKKINDINKNIKILEENNCEKVVNLYNQLKNLNIAKSLSSAFIFGSDYHGKDGIKYTDLEKDLFYIKSECSFQGLRLSLLDYDSRVFSSSRYNKFKKDTNKIIEEVQINVNGENKILKFGDGLNSIIGSRGTGKSYFLNCLLGKTENYSKSDIYNQIKLVNIKLKNENFKKTLDEQIDVDYISQKNSGISKSNNIYDLLSEAPYDTTKFVSKIRNLSTTSNKSLKIDDYFKNVNDCLESFINLDKKKKETFDYNFLSTYNSFYKSSGETFKIVKYFDNYITFCSDHITKSKSEILELEKFNKTLDDFEKYINFVKKIPKYDFNHYEDLSKYINELRKANNMKMELDKKNINRINRTKILVETMKEKASKDISNEGQYYTNSFNNLSIRIKQLINIMLDSLQKSKNINELNKKPIFDKEDIIINKNNISINLSIEYILDIKDKKISELSDVFRNYNSMYIPTLKYCDLFNKFGEEYIKNIYPNKDGRITKGNYNGFDLFAPRITPIIIIEYNGEKKDIAKLSPGEKADILLDLILDPSSNKILIIDQPEDDLDNETIFKKVVSKLRNIKMRRQIIIISHNANLVINGDSDEIIVCIKDSDKYSIINDTMESLNKYDYVSINTSLINDTILNISTHILDGGKVALSKRVKKIGYQDIFLEEDSNESSI